MGALSFSMTDNGTSFGLYHHLPWIPMASSHTACFPQPAGL